MKRVRSSGATLSKILPGFQNDATRVMGNLPAKLLERSGLQQMVHHAKALGCISFRLPKSVVTAGAILHHCIGVVESVLEKQYPLIFKIGFTHDAVWRWSNGLYGYAVSREKWSNMIILHIADEPFSVAMLEAALINRFHGFLASYGFGFKG